MSNLFLSVEIAGIHMRSAYGMVLESSNYAAPPEVKTTYEEIEGADGFLDLSEVLTGRPTYGKRKLAFILGCGFPKSRWPGIYSEILEKIHGRTCRLIFDDDISYFYKGRVKISSYERFQTLGTLGVEVDADPYKYEVVSSLEPWMWDIFDLRTGVIRKYKNLTVQGTLELKINGLPKRIIPSITASAAMTVSFHGKEYALKPGVNKIYQIIIVGGENVLIFRGNGTVSVDYRGGML